MSTNANKKSGGASLVTNLLSCHRPDVQAPPSCMGHSLVAPIDDRLAKETIKFHQVDDRDVEEETQIESGKVPPKIQNGNGKVPTKIQTESEKDASRIQVESEKAYYYYLENLENETMINRCESTFCIASGSMSPIQRVEKTRRPKINDNDCNAMEEIVCCSGTCYSFLGSDWQPHPFCGNETSTSGSTGFEDMGNTTISQLARDGTSGDCISEGGQYDASLYLSEEGGLLCGPCCADDSNTKRCYLLWGTGQDGAQWCTSRPSFPYQTRMAWVVLLTYIRMAWVALDCHRA